MPLPGTHELNAIILLLDADARRIDRYQRTTEKPSEMQRVEARRYRDAAGIVARVRDLTLGGEKDRAGRPTVTVQAIERFGPFSDDEDLPADGTTPESTAAPALSPEDAEILKFVKASGGIDRVRKIVSAWSEELE